MQYWVKIRKCLWISWIMPGPTCINVRAQSHYSRIPHSYHSKTLQSVLYVILYRHKSWNHWLDIFVFEKTLWPLCAPVPVSALVRSSLSVWQSWDMPIGDTRKNILNKTCFSLLRVCTEPRLGWVLHNGVMMRGLKHTQSWPELSRMSKKNTTLRPGILPLPSIISLHFSHWRSWIHLFLIMPELTLKWPQFFFGLTSRKL